MPVMVMMGLLGESVRPAHHQGAMMTQPNESVSKVRVDQVWAFLGDGHFATIRGSGPGG